MKTAIAFDTSHNEEERLKKILKEIKPIMENNNISFVKHENYPISIEDLNNYSVFIIIQTDHSHFESNEVKHIIKYVNSGGKLLLLGNAGGDRAHMTNFSESIVSNFGISFNEDRITDSNKTFEQNPAIFSINEFKRHAIFTDVVPSYSNGCSLNVEENTGRILAWKDSKPLIAERIYGMGNVLIIGSYLLFQLSENNTFFLNIINFLQGKLKQKKFEAPKFQIKIPEKLTKQYALDKSKKNKENSQPDIKIEKVDFLKVIDNILSQIKKFSFHKDLDRIKKIKKSFLFLKETLENTLNIAVDASDNDSINHQIDQVKMQYIIMYDDFLEMDVGIEDKGHIKEFQDLFNHLRLMLEKKFQINLLSEIKNENKIDLEVEKLHNRINNLKFQINEIPNNRKYLIEQFQSKIISKVEYELGLKNLESTKQDYEEQISYLEGRIKLLLSI